MKLIPLGSNKWEKVDKMASHSEFRVEAIFIRKNSTALIKRVVRMKPSVILPFQPFFGVFVW